MNVPCLVLHLRRRNLPSRSKFFWRRAGAFRGYSSMHKAYFDGRKATCALRLSTVGVPNPALSAGSDFETYESASIRPKTGFNDLLQAEDLRLCVLLCEGGKPEFFVSSGTTKRWFAFDRSTEFCAVLSIGRPVQSSRQVGYVRECLVVRN